MAKKNKKLPPRKKVFDKTIVLNLGYNKDQEVYLICAEPSSEEDLSNDQIAQNGALSLSREDVSDLVSLALLELKERVYPGNDYSLNVTPEASRELTMQKQYFDEVNLENAIALLRQIKIQCNNADNTMPKEAAFYQALALSFAVKGSQYFDQTIGASD